MLAPDQGNDLAKAGAMQVDQPFPVLVLLGRHSLEDRG